MAAVRTSARRRQLSSSQLTRMRRQACGLYVGSAPTRAMIKVALVSILRTGTTAMARHTLAHGMPAATNVVDMGMTLQGLTDRQPMKPAAFAEEVPLLLPPTSVSQLNVQALLHASLWQGAPSLWTLKYLTGLVIHGGVRTRGWWRCRIALGRQYGLGQACMSTHSGMVPIASTT